MSTRCRLSPSVLFFLALLVLGHRLWAQPAEPTPTAANGTPTAATPPATESLTLDQIQAKVKEVESDDALPEAVKTKVLELYRAALTRLQSVETYNAKKAAFIAAIESGPQDLETIRQQLAAAAEPSPDGGLDGASLPGTAKENEQKLVQTQAELVAHKNRLAELDQQIAVQQDRPQLARREKADAEQKLLEINTELKTPAPSDESPVLTAARSAALNARKMSRVAESAMLDQELVSHPVRLDLLKAQRDLAARQIADTESRIKTLQDMVNKLRREEAARAQAEAEKAKAAAKGKHPLVAGHAEKNAQLGQELADLTQLIEQAASTRRNVTQKRENIEKDFKSAQEKLEVAGLSDVLGRLLRDQRRKLEDPGRYRRAAAERKEQIATAGLKYLEFEERRQELRSPAMKAQQEVAHIASEEKRSGSYLADLEAEVRVLLEDQKQLLDKLSDAYNRYLTELGDLEFEQQQLLKQAQEYAAFLDERLLWIPSGPPVGLTTLKDLQAAVIYMTRVQNWSATAVVVWKQLVSSPVPPAVSLILLIGLFLPRKKMRVQLDVYAGCVGKIYADSFWLTIGALGITLLLSAGWPLLMGWVAWQLYRSDSFSTSGFPQTVGLGLAGTAQLLFGLRCMRLFLQKENGVAEAHLRWRPQTTSLLRKHLFWLACLALPAVFITVMTEGTGEESFRQSLGRLAFMVAMLGLAAFVGLVLHPRGGVMDNVVRRNPNGWLARLRYVWYLLAIGLPLFLAGLAAAGYYYTALELTHRMLATILVVVVAIVGHELFMRWLFVANRKLAIAKAREKREAELRQSGDKGDGEGKEIALELPEVDLATINAQTRQLLRVTVTVWVVVGLWVVWTDVVPALNMLDQVPLWQHSVMIDGQETLEPITLASLALAIVITAATVAAARNLPGVLEIAVLQHLPLDSGSRYAITTVSRYVITTIGAVAAFGVLGVNWSHLQWLVAALGVGLGFGLQEIFANFVSGLIILFERPFRVGDTVTVGDISGTVSRIQIRATTVTDWDRKELIVPNKAFITDRLINWTLTDPITRLIVKVGIAYGSDTALARRLMMEIAEKLPSVLDDPKPSVFFMGFGASSLDFEVRVFVAEVTNRGRVEIMHEMHMAIDQAFREHGVVIAFPQVDVHFDPPPDGPAAPTNATGHTQPPTTEG